MGYENSYHQSSAWVGRPGSPQICWVGWDGCRNDSGCLASFLYKDLVFPEHICLAPGEPASLAHGTWSLLV